MVARAVSHVKNKYGKNEKKVLGIARGPAQRQQRVAVIDLDLVPGLHHGGREGTERSGNHR